jgi:hypothetical protein
VGAVHGRRVPLHRAPTATASTSSVTSTCRRTWGAFDGDAWWGRCGPSPPLHGARPDRGPVAALTNVTVAPTHRRRGLLTEMITADLRATAERGEPVGILIASEYPIYGRFGYGAAIEAASPTRWTWRPPAFAAPGPAGVELVDLVHAAAGRHRPLRALPRRATGLDRTRTRWWDRALHQVEVPGAKAPEGYQAVYRSPTGPRGIRPLPGHADDRHMRPTGELTWTSSWPPRPPPTNGCGATAARWTSWPRSGPATARRRAPGVAPPRRPHAAPDGALRLRLGARPRCGRRPLGASLCRRRSPRDRGDRRPRHRHGALRAGGGPSGAHLHPHRRQRRPVDAGRRPGLAVRGRRLRRMACGDVGRIDEHRSRMRSTGPR